MSTRTCSTMQEAASQLLETLERGEGVTLEVTAQDTTNGGLVRLISELHTIAQERQLAVRLMPVGERGVRPSLGCDVEETG